MARITVRRDDMMRFFHNPNGPLARDVKQKIEAVRKKAQESAPVRTGLYKATFATKLTIGNGVLRGSVTNTVPYAAVVEFGSRPHIIRARRAPYLVFPGRSGKLIFTKSVNHPGTKPQNILGNAAKSVLGGFP